MSLAMNLNQRCAVYRNRNAPWSSTAQRLFPPGDLPGTGMGPGMVSPHVEEMLYQRSGDWGVQGISGAGAEI